MNKYIEELVNSWGLGTDTHVITAIIVLMSVITMCAVFWLIFHLVSPKSSHFRELCFKAIICTTAVLLVVTTFVSIGGNVVIREQLVTKENNANIRTSSIEPMQLYDRSNNVVNVVIGDLINAMGANADDFDLYASVYAPAEIDEAIGMYVTTTFMSSPLTNTIYAPYISSLEEVSTSPSVSLTALADPLRNNALLGGKALIVVDKAYIVVALPKGYIPYECKQYNGQPVIIEVNPKMPYDPNFD